MKKAMAVMCLAMMCLTGCVSFSYTDPKGAKVEWNSFGKDITAVSVRAEMNEKGATINVGRVKSDVSEVIKETVKAVEAGLAAAR